MAQEIKVKIQKFNPAKDKKPYLKEYIVEVESNTTILDVIRKVQTKHDPDLSFKLSCNTGVCGSCAMRVNGRACLSCKIHIKEEIQEYQEIIIQPLGNLEIEKDLIVNMKPFYQTIKDIQPWLQAGKEVPKGEYRVGEGEIRETFNAAKCLWCAACFSDCPSRDASKDYLGPASFVNSYRFISDPRDAKTKERVQKAIKGQAWMCAHCEKSADNCPEEINPTDLISLIKEKSIKLGIKGNTGAKHALSIHKSIKKKGEIDEFRLIIETLSILGLVKYIPIALRMIMKGKIPPMFLKKIKNIHQIAGISERIKKESVKEEKKKQKKRYNYKTQELQ